MEEQNKVLGVKPVIKEAKTKQAKIENYETIFTLVEIEKGKIKIAVTNKIISAKEFKTMKEAKSYIDSKPWELIINATCCIYDIEKQTSK